MANDLTVQDDNRHLGPAMKACSEKERLFVEHLMQNMPMAEAARQAGYGTPDSNARTMAQIGWRLSHRDRVIDAIQEITRKMVRTSLPDAVQAVKAIVRDPSHKDRARVALNLIERVDPTITKQEIEVTHKFDPLKTTLEYLAHLKEIGAPRDVLVREFGQGGLDHYEKLLAQQAAPIIDAEFKEIGKDPDFDLIGDV